MKVPIEGVLSISKLPPTCAARFRAFRRFAHDLNLRFPFHEMA
jgi:hypothetical protein